MGRAWVAPPGTSLLLSVVLRPPLHREAVWLTVAAAGVALAEDGRRGRPGRRPGRAQVAQRPGAARPQGGRAAGRTHLAGDRLAAVLLGMGVNVAQTAADLPPEVADRATSVSLAAGAPVDRAELLAAWAGRFLGGYQTLCAGRPGAVLAAYRERLATVGQRVGPTASAPTRWSAPPSTSPPPAAWSSRPPAAPGSRSWRATSTTCGPPS